MSERTSNILTALLFLVLIVAFGVALSIGSVRESIGAFTRIAVPLNYFLALGGLLFMVGLYGVLAYGVAQRTGEIAIRIALGAQSGRVISMILRETAGVVAVGLGLGGGLAYAASRLIDSRLYGVAPQDPLTLALAIGLLLLVALSAAYLPAQRASKLDPMAALRQQ